MNNPYELADNFENRPITKFLGNMGLVAVAMKELRIRELIDEMVPNRDSGVKISHGQAVEALIISALNSYLPPPNLNFSGLINLDLQRMIGCDSMDFSDDILSETLDALWDSPKGVEGLFSAIAAAAAKQSGLEMATCKPYAEEIVFFCEGLSTDDPFAVSIAYKSSGECFIDPYKARMQVILASSASTGVGFPIAIKPLGKGSDELIGFDEDENLLKECLNSFAAATSCAEGEWSDKELRNAYKKQRVSERGFRFLGDTVFYTSPNFLDKTTREHALMTVMTLSLLVYSYLEHKIRNTLKEREMLWQSRSGKPIDNPKLSMMFDYYTTVMTIYRSGMSEVSLVPFHWGVILLEILGDEYIKMYEI